MIDAIKRVIDYSLMHSCYAYSTGNDIIKYDIGGAHGIDVGLVM